MEIFEFIRINWAILAFVGGIIGSWAFFKFTLQSHDMRITALEDAQGDANEAIQEIKQDLREIKTSIKFIVDKLR